MTDTFRVKVRFKALKPGWQQHMLERMLEGMRTLPRPSGPFWQKSITPPGTGFHHPGACPPVTDARTGRQRDPMGIWS